MDIKNRKEFEQWCDEHKMFVNATECELDCKLTSNGGNMMKAGETITAEIDWNERLNDWANGIKKHVETLTFEVVKPAVFTFVYQGGDESKDFTGTWEDAVKRVGKDELIDNYCQSYESEPLYEYLG